MIDLVIAGAGGAVVGALATGVYAPNSRIFGRAIGRGRRDRPFYYLTFDDGPNPGATEPILETLAEHGVPATFFMVGMHVQRSPHIARRVAEAGHDIGNHTHHHVKLHRCGPARIRSELELAHAAISGATGRAPALFRAPHGYRNPFVAGAARDLGYTVFGWSFGVWDSARPSAEEVRRRVRAKLAPGAIVLLHDGDGDAPNGDRSATVSALAGILRDARAAGLEPRPLRELLA